MYLLKIWGGVRTVLIMANGLFVEAMLLVRGPVGRDLEDPVYPFNMWTIPANGGNLPNDTVILLYVTGLRRATSLSLFLKYWPKDTVDEPIDVLPKPLTFTVDPPSDIRIPRRFEWPGLAHKLPGVGLFRYEIYSGQIKIAQTTFFAVDQAEQSRDPKARPMV
jgi:hypothetical protein